MIFWIISKLIKSFSKEQLTSSGSDWYTRVYTIYLSKRFIVTYYYKNTVWEGTTDEQISINWKPFWTEDSKWEN